jgi:hypothetical protein
MREKVFDMLESIAGLIEQMAPLLAGMLLSDSATPPD